MINIKDNDGQYSVYKDSKMLFSVPFVLYENKNIDHESTFNLILQKINQYKIS